MIDNAVLGRNVASFLSMFAAKPLKQKGQGERFDEQAAIVSKISDMETGLINIDPVVVKKGLTIYDEMIDDDSLGAFLDMKKAARLSTPWKIIPASDERRDIEIQEFVEHSIVRMKGTFKDKLREILDAIDYGFSVTNKPLGLLEDGPFKGNMVIRDLKTKPPHNVTFKTDEFGNILDKGILYKDPDTMLDEPLDKNAFIVYTYRKKYERPYGRSDCRRCFPSWNSKRWVNKFWDIYLERFGSGFIEVIHKAGKGTTTDHDTLERFIKQMSARTGIKHSDIFEIVMHETSGRGADVFEARIKHLNIAMARTVLVPDLLGFSEKPTGSYALGKKHFDVFLWVLEDLGEDLTETVIGEQFIKPMVDMNYENVEKYPQFAFDPLTDEEKFEILNSLYVAVEKGVIEPDLEIENYVRRMLEQTEKEKSEEEKAGGSAQLPTKAKQDIEGEDKEPIIPDHLPQDKQKIISISDRRQEGFSYQANLGEARLMRPLNQYERKVNFESIIQMINDSQRTFVDTWSDLFRVQQKGIIKWVNSKKIIELRKGNLIKDLQLPRKMDLTKSLQRYLLMGIYFGALQAKEEVERGAKKKFSLSEMPLYFAVESGTIPIDEIEKAFLAKGLTVNPAIKRAAAEAKRKAFYITGVETEKILSKAQIILHNAVNRGDRLWAETQLKKLFVGYIKTGEIKPGPLGTVSRIETIGRTNFTAAFNDGRRRMFEDPDVEDFVEAYQVSAVIDSATTDICRSLDGKIITKEDLNAFGWPPYDYNCRTIVIPIIRGEEYKLNQIPSGITRRIGFSRYVCSDEAFTWEVVN